MKKLISNEINSIVKSCYDAFAKVNKAECKHYPLSQGQTIGVGRVKIMIAGKQTYLTLHEDVNKTYMAEWRKDVGTILSKDAKKENYDPYYTFSTDTFTVLMRRVDDSELKDFENYNIIKLGDYNYVIIKLIKKGHSFMEYDPLTEELPAKEEDPDDDYELVEEPENDIESVSLF